MPAAGPNPRPGAGESQAPGTMTPEAGVHDASCASRVGQEWRPFARRPPNPAAAAVGYMLSRAHERDLLARGRDPPASPETTLRCRFAISLALICLVLCASRPRADVAVPGG